MNKLKVMLMEDEAVVLEGYKKLFDWEGRGCAVVCEAGDGISAVSMADRYRPDIILMDINIPRLSGLEAIEAIPVSLLWAWTKDFLNVFVRQPLEFGLLMTPWGSIYRDSTFSTPTGYIRFYS
jgi:DNA-binding LytR/AlgR family response regulator